MKYLTVVLTLFISLAVSASESDKLVLSFASKHINSPIQFNEQNYGAGYETKLTGSYWLSIGQYTDSFSNRQSYVGIIRYVKLTRQLSYGYSAGLITHTLVDNGKTPFPFIFPVGDLRISNNINLTVSWLPKVTADTYNTLGFQLKVGI